MVFIIIIIMHQFYFYKNKKPIKYLYNNAIQVQLNVLLLSRQIKYGK